MSSSYSYVYERHETLGPDLATASFIMAHGGEVKFRGHDNWLKKQEDGNIPLPRHFKANMDLEAVDASDTTFMYESFENFGKTIEYVSVCYVLHERNMIKMIEKIKL